MNKVREGDVKGTKDLWFASFLISEGCNLSDFKVTERGKGEYYFDIDNENYKDMKLKFHNNKISEIKMITEKLKDLCY